MKRSTVDPVPMGDEISALLIKARELPSERLAIVGTMAYVLLDEHGEIKQAGSQRNLINDKGDEFYAKKGASVAVNAVVGMKVGTHATPSAATKNGANSTLQTYTTGITANKAIDGGFPTAATKGAGAGWRITWQTTYAAGEATHATLSEIIITNQASFNDVAPAQADTICRALLVPIVNKGANDTLIITWQHDFLGA